MILDKIIHNNNQQNIDNHALLTLIVTDSLEIFVKK